MNLSDCGDNIPIYFKLSSLEYYTVGISVMLFGMLGVCSNTVSVVMFVKDRRFRTSVDILLLNLAIADLGMTSVCFPFLVSSNFAQYWVHGQVGCTIYGLLSFLFGNASITTLSTISIERFLIICKSHPATAVQRTVTLVKVIGFIWLHSLLWALLPITTGVGYTLEPFQTSCTVNWMCKSLLNQIFILGLFVIVIGTNIAIMAFCYINIFIKARGDLVHRRTIEEVMLTKVCFSLMAGFLLCWMPYAVVSMWGAYGDPYSIPQAVTVVPVVFAKMSTCINPILYVIVSNKFRKRYFDVLRCKRFNRLFPSHVVTIQASFREYNGH